MLYPPACLLCRAPLSAVPGPSFREERGAVLCDACELACPRNAKGGAPWQYAEGAARAIQQFKYHRRWRIGRWLADGMADLARTSLPIHEIDAVVPVPLHWAKRRLRGFDPVGQLAQHVAGSLARTYLPHALRRTRWTATQTRLQGRARQRNVQGAFTAKPQLVNRLRLLLIDDVLTSGATAEACVSALQQAGAASVRVLTAARTP